MCQGELAWLVLNYWVWNKDLAIMIGRGGQFFLHPASLEVLLSTMTPLTLVAWQMCRGFGSGAKEGAGTESRIQKPWGGADGSPQTKNKTVAHRRQANWTGEETLLDTETIWYRIHSGAGLYTQGKETQVKHIRNRLRREIGTKTGSKINYNIGETRTFRIKQDVYEKTCRPASDTNVVQPKGFN